MRSLTVFLTLTGFIILVCAETTKVKQQNERVKIGHRNLTRSLKNVRNFAKSRRHLVPMQDEDDKAIDETQPNFGNPPDEANLKGEGDPRDIDTINGAEGDSSQPKPPVDQNQPNNENINKVKKGPRPRSKRGPSRDTTQGPRRGIKAGDTFTPNELLPITKKLISKMENPGEGKGIVSSAKNPEELADNLFEAFFFGPRRVVILQELDIPGLDALQALALSGEEATNTGEYVTVTEPGYMMRYRDQIVEVSRPKTSRYMLLSKPLASPKNALRTDKTKKKDTKYIKNNVLRKRVNLTRGLQKHRQLVLNPARKYNKINKKASGKKKIIKKSSKKGSVANKHNQKKKRYHVKNPGKPSYGKITPASPRSDNIGTTRYPWNASCRWRYVCIDPADLDTCHLRTQCSKHKLTSTNSDYIGPEEQDDMVKDLRRFRKMLKITPVDEEVEKILEARMLRLKPQFPYAKDVARIESLSQYFNNILMAEMSERTTGKYRETAVTEPGPDEDYNEDDNDEKKKDDKEDAANDNDDVKEGDDVKEDDKNEPINNDEPEEDGIVEIEDVRRFKGKPKVPIRRPARFKV